VSEEAPDTGDSQAPATDRERRAGAGGILTDLGKGLSGALRPLSGLAGMADDIRGMTEHVKRMASNTETLPDVTETLHAIRERTEHIDKEVTEMHAAVDELRELLIPVAGQLESVTRVTNRLPGGRKHRRAQAEADAAAAAEDAALDEEAARVRDAE
jgi:methyl-accepting chemotaxis protein